MARENNVVAVCDSMEEAEVAVNELEQSGVNRGSLSIEKNKVVVTAKGAEAPVIRDVLNAEGKGVEPYEPPSGGQAKEGKARAQRQPRRKAASPEAQGGSMTDLGEGDSTQTIDHEVIQEWIEARGGQPSTVKGTSEKGGEAGLLRVDFPGYGGAESLQHISWDEFFQKFEEKNLAFLFQEQKKDGELSNFCKFVSRQAS